MTIFLWRTAVLLALIQATVATPWATPAQEALDEKNDAEIFRAVVNSMQQWHKKHDSHRRRKRAESQVCYDGLGCFQDSGPFGYLDMLPSKPEEVGTRFLLYASRVEPALDVPFANLSQVWPWAERAFNFSVPTKVIVHGFGSDCDHVWVYEMKSALMAVENCNVICIDWGNGAAVPNYVRASANTRLVGKQLALLLAGLKTRLGLNLETTHVIGFSLGAHVAGFAGAQLNNLSRITGLDPAGPLFESQDPRARLDSSDAMFVDVIHSNGENLILGGLGSWQPMGHVDFYPNGGRMQKGCSNLFVGAVTDILWSATEVEGRSLCNHRRAYKFFTDSLSPRCHFPAFPCESYEKFLEGSCFPCAGDKRCGNMGYYADKSNVRGTLFLITRDEEPFCAHQYHVRIESAPSVPPAVSYGKIQITLVGSENINETFTLTQKDDAEIRVGVPLTRIAVPHPALQEPRSVQLMYTAYSGWISSGLSKWGIDKLSLTDSFGKSMSVCKKGLMLDSGVPVTLPLYPGECNPPRGTNVTLSTIIAAPSAANAPPTNRTSPSSSLLDFFRFKPTPVVQMGDEILPNKNSAPHHHTTVNPLELPPSRDALTTPGPFLGHAHVGLPKISDDLPREDERPDTLPILDITDPSATQLVGGLPWMPVEYSHTNSLLDKDVHEDSRAFNSEDILVLGEQTNGTVNLTDTNKNANNNFSVINVNIRFNVGGSNNSNGASEAIDVTVRPEIKEPVLLSTTSRSSWDETSANKTSTFRPRAISLVDDTYATTWRPEIKEPILNPTTPKSKAIKTRSNVAGSYDNTWLPKQDLKPPPLGSSWHHWNMKDDVATPFEEWRRGGNTGGTIGTVGGLTNYQVPKVASGNVATSPFREMFASPRIDLNVDGDANLVQDDDSVNTSSENTPKFDTTPNTTKRSGRQMIQLFPHRLAALLSQAERYARGQFSPFAKQKKTHVPEQQQVASTVSRKLNVEENDAIPQRRPKYFPNMQDGLQSLSLNNPIQLLLNIFNGNKSKVEQEKGDVQIVQLSKTVGIAKDENGKDVVYGAMDPSTMKPMQISKEHVEQSVSRDIAHTRVLVPYTYDTNKENTHKYIPLKDPTESTATEHE